MPPELKDLGFTERIVGTYLTRRPDPEAFMVTLISTLILFLASIWIWFSPQNLEQWTVASRELVYDGHQYWRLWTATLTHANIGHLLSNSLLFFVLGYFLSGYFGVFMFPISAFVLGGMINAIAVWTYAPTVKLLGASGVVYWMGGVWLVLYLLIDTQRSWGSRWLRSLGVAIMMFLPAEAFDPQVSYRTHFIGFAVGIATGLLYYAANASRLRAAEVIEILPPEPELENN